MNHVAEATASYKKFWRDLKSGRFVSMVKEASKGETLSNAVDVFNVMKPLFGQHPDVEVVYGIFLDSGNKVLAINKMFTGTISHATVYTREIVKRIIRYKSTSLIFAHNHPGGNPEPSLDDIILTRRVFAALLCIDAKLLDHIIVGESFFSFAEEGYIAKFKSEYSRLLRG